MRIVFWQNIPSFHQSATIRALADMERCEVTLALQDDLPKSFQDGGWSVPYFGNARLVHPKNDHDIRNLIAAAGADAVHIFTGFRFPMVRRALHATLQTNTRIGMIAEAADWRGLKGLARLLLYRFELLRFGSRIDFILAMGQLGVSWYSRCGFPPSRIYPYAYVVEKTAAGEVLLTPPNDTIRLIYVGQCIERKGLDLLLSALAKHKRSDWHLDIVGDGPEKDKLLRQSAESELTAKITFHGALRNAAARQMIAESDCLLLPSRWDGWGAVVNEALLLGTPVICSDLCGAADLLGNLERGEMFKAGSAVALQVVLERRIFKKKRTREATDSIKSWTKSIEGETVARYLLDVIDAAAGVRNRPPVPWRNEGQTCG